MFDSNKYTSLETLLNHLYQLFEYDSPIYIDELGYKWYKLETVLSILDIDVEEYINGIYLMNIEETTFISEEGVNLLILDYDNEYQENVRELLASEVMPDIKSDSLYIGNSLIDNIRIASIRYQVFNSDSAIEELNTMNKMQKYTERKINRKEKVQKKQQYHTRKSN